MRRIGETALALLVGILCACERPQSPAGGAAAAPFGAIAAGLAGMSAVTTIEGEGATFAKPLYEVWGTRYAQQTGVRVRYRATGSRRGIEAVMARKVDFAGSEAPMTNDELTSAGPVVHIPITVAPVAIIYNQVAAPNELKLTPDVLAGIFLGEITRWDDPRIAWVNGGLKLPPAKIEVIHRSDGSGTTKVLTDYLSRVSPAWKEKVGSRTSVKWPTGTGAVGNDGVAEAVNDTPGSIGYVVLAYARVYRLKVAAIGNRAGRFVSPTLDGATAAAAAVANDMPADLRVSIVDTEGEDAYPITSFSYLLVHEDVEDPARGAAVAQFAWWALHDGQSFGPALHYATVPPEIVSRAGAALQRLQSNGKPLFNG